MDLLSVNDFLYYAVTIFSGIIIIQYLMNKIKLIVDQPVIIGKEILKVPEGTILQVVGCPENWSETDGKDDIVIRTNDNEYILVSLSDGVIWKESSQTFQCKFIILNGIQIN